MQMGTPHVELTLSELQEMAVRQQQQIEAQQQMLMAKVSTFPLHTAVSVPCDSHTSEPHFALRVFV